MIIIDPVIFKFNVYIRIRFPSSKRDLTTIAFYTIELTKLPDCFPLLAWLFLVESPKVVEVSLVFNYFLEQARADHF